MKLKDLLASITPIAPIPASSTLESEVTGICTNSHAGKPGDVFIGLPGTRVDGGDFWKSALDAGAIASIVSPAAAAKFPPGNGELVIAVEDTVSACASIAATFYHHPARTLKLIGVTGTNGKTTTTHLIEYFLQRANLPAALFGTLYTRWPGFLETASHTTPFANELQAGLAKAVSAGNRYAILEVSSHALAQGRVRECPFAVSVFTNLTRDHLDFHPDMEDYFAAKAKLFSPDYLAGRAVINLDDPYGRRLADSLPRERVWTYSVLDAGADFYTKELQYQPAGVSGIMVTPVGEVAFDSPLVGQYNLANLLAAVAAVLEVGLELEMVAAGIPFFSGVPGRMEGVRVSESQDISVIVDYAHTPDSLENVLKASRPFIAGRMICVFGCGGDRDRTKRPVMGKIAAELADLAIVTSDNPRTEDPDRILADIVAGIPENLTVEVIGDRALAIQTAIREARSGDGVIIAGKGHEDYQILGTEKIHFDDREQATDALAFRFG